jgi:iron complex outermembrane recepter protein
MRSVAYWAAVAEIVFTLGLAAAAMFPSAVMANADAASLSSDAGSTAADTEPSIGLEEVIVTAQKRDTKLEKTPIAVPAFTPDFIDRNRIQRSIPGKAYANFAERPSVLTVVRVLGWFALGAKPKIVRRCSDHEVLENC